MQTTPIEWTRNNDGSPGHAVNPLRARLIGTTGRSGHYCEKISAGCTNCYSGGLQWRFGMPDFGAGQHLDKVELFLDIAKLQAVIRHRKPTRIFWCDMTDMFGRWVPDEWIDRCFATMALAGRHTHMVLTKRADRMRDYVRALGRDFGRLERAAREVGYTLQFDGHPLVSWPLPNVWLGTSVENQEQADQRVPLLLETPAAVHFLSCEPLLSWLDIRQWLHDSNCTDRETCICSEPREDRVDWCIVGGESGKGSRPCSTEWVRGVVEQCRQAGAACFVKQLGSVAVGDLEPTGKFRTNPETGKRQFETTTTRLKLAHPKGGGIHEFPTDLQIREWPR